MEIIRVPVLADNYIFVLYDIQTQAAVVVDPAIADPILHLLEDLKATLVAIWNTHHHHDHVGGNRDLLNRFPSAKVFAGTYDQQRHRIPGQTDCVTAGDRLTFASHDVVVMDCPGHTLGHIAYYVLPSEADEPGHLFCGDTLFAGGCGRLFEGTPQQMMTSLDQFRQLPPNTQIWCAHEYTSNNLKFAISVDPTNAVLRDRYVKVSAQRAQGQPTIPAVLSQELQTNPFLRWDAASVQNTVQCDYPLEVFTKIRRMKDRY